MRARFPLYARILCWFFLNIGLIGAGLYMAFRSSGAANWLIMQQAGPQLESLSRLLVPELQPLPPNEWTDVLRKYSDAYGVNFAVFGGNGRQLAGDSLTLPEKVRARVLDGPLQPQGVPLPGGAPQPNSVRPNGQPFVPVPRQPQPDQNNRPFPKPGQPPVIQPGGEPRFANPGEPERRDQFRPAQGMRPGAPAGPFAKFIEHTDSPRAWWFIVRVPLQQPRQGPSSLVLMTENLTSGGLLVDFTPWIWGGGGLLLLTSLLWFPLVRGITRRITGMKKATSRIAEGRFDVQVPDKGRDELAELAGGINRMAARLSGYVSGQKRFLGDIAHELCTPLARMQMAAAALEQRAPADLQPRVADLTSEVEAMSQLVSELLDFSRAGLAPQSVPLAPVPLLTLVEQVLVREGVLAEQVHIQIAPGLSAMTNSSLVTRALANVVRNSLRYAGPQCHLEIRAGSIDREHVLTISDNGPGVPEDALPKLFDPFFRLEAARDREHGGTGLGLAIVQTCITACAGAVTARNRQGGGLEIEIRLPAA